jgi:hypothetical protein
VIAVTDSASIDADCAAAVDLARAAAVETAQGDVGPHLGVRGEGERLVTHAFAAMLPGYVGWYWAVTVGRAPGLSPTVAEVVLLPGDGALLAPAWVPWNERLQPGDLSPGDLLPTAPDDPRLVPAYVLSDEPEVEEVAFELGIGRLRVLSRPGRLDTAERWYAGDGGPDTPMARQAPAHCGSCGFYVQLAGSLRAAFGVCANEIAETDGRVVSADHGCGAHSEAVIEVFTEEPSEVFDDNAIDLMPPDQTDVPIGRTAKDAIDVLPRETDLGAELGEPTANVVQDGVVDAEAVAVQTTDGTDAADAGQTHDEPGRG